jgi:hypothetical protein
MSASIPVNTRRRMSGVVMRWNTRDRRVYVSSHILGDTRAR